jgi:hypothetical protein
MSFGSSKIFFKTFLHRSMHFTLFPHTVHFTKSTRFAALRPLSGITRP